MIKNATWQSDIQELNPEYKTLYLQLNKWFIENNIVNPNKFWDLWMFYNFWRNKENKLDGYWKRRDFINTIYQPILTWEGDKTINPAYSYIHPEILSHTSKYLESWHNFTAVEESYKIVRQRLIALTWKEKAHEAFGENNILKIFKTLPANQAEENYREWVKFLNLAIQNFRNEKAHTIAKELDEVKTIHYLYLASLALILISC